MERIPKNLQDMHGEIKTDMPIAASFITDEKGSHHITLKNTDFKETKHGDERIPGTGLTIVFEGGKRLIDNKTILQALMGHRVFIDGRIRVDPEDPTGFWREAGVLVPEKKEVMASTGLGPNPSYGSLSKRLKDMKAPEVPHEPIVLDYG